MHHHTATLRVPNECNLLLFLHSFFSLVSVHRCCAYITALLQLFTVGQDQPIISRWQSVVTVWMGAVLHSAVAYGYPNSMEGVEKFTQAYDELQRSDSRGEELQAAAKERWGLLFSRGLGMDVEKEDIPLVKAQEIVRQQCNDMQKESFLEKIDAELKSVRSKLPAGTTEEEAKMKMQEAILIMLMPLQMNVYGSHGYEGDEGYIRMQAALLNHHGDEQIMYNTAVATTVLFRRAGLMPQ